MIFFVSIYARSDLFCSFRAKTTQTKTDFLKWAFTCAFSRMQAGTVSSDITNFLLLVFSTEGTVRTKFQHLNKLLLLACSRSKPRHMMSHTDSDSCLTGNLPYKTHGSARIEALNKCGELLTLLWDSWQPWFAGYRSTRRRWWVARQSDIQRLQHGCRSTAGLDLFAKVCMVIW